MMQKSLAKKAFTLIELLVVISIIALLIGILLPVLGTARESGKAMACSSNTRQINLAMDLYHGDNDGMYVPVVFSSPTRYWTEVIVRDGQYLSVVNAFDCPSLNSTIAAWQSPPAAGWGVASSNWRYTEIGYNHDFIGTGTRVIPVPTNIAISARVDEIRKPTETIILADAIRLDVKAGWSTIFSYFHPTSGHATPRHQDTVNVAWADGHASRVKTTSPAVGPIGAYTTDALTSRSDTINFWDRN